MIGECVCPSLWPRLYKIVDFFLTFLFLSLGTLLYIYINIVIVVLCVHVRVCVCLLCVLLLICFLYFLPVIPKGKKNKKKHCSFTCGRDGDRFVFKKSGSVRWSFYFDSDSNHRLTDQPEIFVSPTSTTPRTRQFQHGSALNCLIYNISVRFIPYR